MSRIHFVVKESAKLAYQSRAHREGKSLGQWLREAADKKLASSRPASFTVEDLRNFAAECDGLHRPGDREPDWSDTKRLLVETRYRRTDNW